MQLCGAGWGGVVASTYRKPSEGKRWGQEGAGKVVSPSSRSSEALPGSH